MATLDRVLQLQSQGMQDTDIIRILREEGISPVEINDSLNQAKIKVAVSGSTPDSNNATNFSDMDQSMMSQEDISGGMPEQVPVNEEPQYDQPYSQTYYQPTGLDAETITEVAEQIVIEKLDEFTRRVGDLVAFRSDVHDKIKDIEEKIKRIESSLDKIQQAVIGKVGEYGDNLNLIKKDMGSLHDTMSKLMNPLIDNYLEMKKLNDRKSA